MFQGSKKFYLLIQDLLSISLLQVAFRENLGCQDLSVAQPSHGTDTGRAPTPYFRQDLKLRMKVDLDHHLRQIINP